MTAILVVTIGTRDLMYQATSGTWYNIGNDRLKEDESITEKIEALSDLKLGESTTYRDLTHHLLQHQGNYSGLSFNNFLLIVSESKVHFG